MAQDHSTSVTTSGGTVSVGGSIVGGSGNRVEHHAATAPGASPEQVLALLAEIRKAAEAAPDLPEQVRADVREDAAAAERSLRRPEPDLARAAGFLTQTKAVLGGLVGSIQSAVALREMVASALRLLG